MGKRNYELGGFAITMLGFVAWTGLVLLHGYLGRCKAGCDCWKCR